MTPRTLNNKALLNVIANAFPEHGYDLESATWGRFVLNFSHAEDHLHTLIDAHIGFNHQGEEKAGIYKIYSNGTLLYIGKAKVIRKRLLDHYAAAHGIRNQNVYWQQFWWQYRNGDLEVRWLELDDPTDANRAEILRCIFESVLIYQEKPTFEPFKKEKVREKRAAKKAAAIATRKKAPNSPKLLIRPLLRFKDRDIAFPCS